MMNMRPLFAAVCLVFVAHAVHAQSVLDTTQNPADPKKAIANAATRGARPALPAGLPGARADRALPAPANELISAMSPNDALFDAVNRGDVAAARDALGRGADIDGRNILGLTPLDLSVDLGRNDLTFLLLSLRGANPGARQAKVASRVAAVSKSPAAPLKVAVAARVTARAPTTTAAGRPAPRYGADTGTPAPSAGFLGFGGLSQ